MRSSESAYFNTVLRPLYVLKTNGTKIAYVYIYLAKYNVIWEYYQNENLFKILNIKHFNDFFL